MFIGFALATDLTKACFGLRMTVHGRGKTAVNRQDCDAGGPTSIELKQSNILGKVVGSVISSYPPSGDDIAFILSAEPYLHNSHPHETRYPHQQCPANSINYPVQTGNIQNGGAGQMKSGLFRPPRDQKWHRCAPFIKRGTSHFAESQTTVYRKDIWTRPTSMEAFGIFARWLPDAIDQLVHPSAIMAAEVMDRFRRLGSFYEPYQYRLSVTSLQEIYKNYLTAQFTRLRRYAL